jgi:hypothetical protein
MPLILGTNSIKDTGYTVANSVRFNPGDSPHMYKTPGSDGDRKTWTFSIWCKRGNIGVRGELFGVYNESNDLTESFRFNTDDTLMYEEDISGTDYEVSSTMLFRDPSAWYHIVLIRDTNESTEANRVKLFVNGVQDTLVESGLGFPAEDGLSSQINQQHKHYVGSGSNTAYFFDGYLAEAVFIDGTAYAATSFGEFNSDSPRIWQPIDVSGLTFGTNGFYLDFEDSSNLGNDANGGTDFTEANLAATDQATDTPTNSFATLNPLEYSGGGKTFSQGNCKLAMSSVANFTRSTIGASSGKWYCEVKLISGTRAMYGISSYLSNATSNYLGEIGNTTTGYSYGIKGNDGRLYHAGSSTATWVGAVSADDIVMIAMDLDNYKLYFGNNGTWERSGDPTSGATGTGAYTIVAPSLNGTGFYHFAFGGNDTSYAYNSETNFGGCSSFTVSSGNADDNGYGNFEYDVPAGYYALNTKNLAEFG